MIIPIFFPGPTEYVEREPFGSKLSHEAVSIMLEEEQDMLEQMEKLSMSESDLQFQKGKIAGLRLAQGITVQNTGW